MRFVVFPNNKACEKTSTDEKNSIENLSLLTSCCSTYPLVCATIIVLPPFTHKLSPFPWCSTMDISECGTHIYALFCNILNTVET